MSRHLDESLALRFPALFRLVAGRVAGMPPTSRLRRRILERSLNRAYEALSRGDIEFALLNFASDFELNYIGGPVGFADRYRGHEGMREFIRDWLTEWGTTEYAVEHLIDLGDRLVYRYKVVASGGSSGVQVTDTQGGVAHVKGGSIGRLDIYWHWADLVETLGLDNRADAPAASAG
jgi:ketosteroid isomerase-like protein